MKIFRNGMVSLIKTPTSDKNKLMVRIDVDGEIVFVPHGSVVIEQWHDGVEHNKLSKIWATEKANKGDLFEVVDKIWEDSRLITDNGSFDHFLELRNTTNKEVSYGGTTVGNPLSAYYEVSKKRAFMDACDD